MTILRATQRAIWLTLCHIDKLYEPNCSEYSHWLMASTSPELSNFNILGVKLQQGNSVARDLPRIGSETNTTIFVIYILDIDSHCPYLLSGETTFQLTSCYNSLHVYLRIGETTSHLTSKWRGTFQYFQSHDKIPYIYYLEKPPPI